MNKEDVVYTHTVEYYPAIKKNKISTFAMMWMELEGIVFLWGQKNPLKEIASHSSILTWRIPMDRRAWRATVHRVAESRTRMSD